MFAFYRGETGLQLLAPCPMSCSVERGRLSELRALSGFLGQATRAYFYLSGGEETLEICGYLLCEHFVRLFALTSMYFCAPIILQVLHHIYLS